MTALASEVIHYIDDPLGFVRDVYPWGDGSLQDATGPREWQANVLRDIGSALREPATRHNPIMIAAASGHGIGKSALVGMVVNWAMSTCDDCRVIVTANTETQLRTKTWPEITKWVRLGRTSSMWDTSAMSVSSAEPGHDKSWRADAIPWSEHNTEAFAGLHNQGKRIVLIFDESSAIADRVWEVAEGALTDEDTEIIWLAFGNPTRNTGRFRECFRRYRSKWITYQIDSREVEGTNKSYLDDMVSTYGEDSDIVKIRIRGVFPAASAKQFISQDDVDAAFGRDLRPEQYSFAPVILTVDPAWEGDDDLVIAKRQGLRFDVLRVIPKNDNDNQIGNIVAQLEDEHRADAVFIDMGYGTGIASAGRTMHRNWQLVSFAEAPSDSGYLNKRAEMWGCIKQWLKSGGAIPPDNALRDDLIGPETVARPDGRIQLESKKNMKDRGIPSPNRADALALSFARPVRKRAAALPTHARFEYNFMEDD